MKSTVTKDTVDGRNILQKYGSGFCDGGSVRKYKWVENMQCVSNDSAMTAVGCGLQEMSQSNFVVKPFVKWAGGKSQLLNRIRKTYPTGIGTNINKYAEPFVGGGAVLFDILTSYKLQEIYISDINAELINAYCMIRDHVSELIDLLKQFQTEYIPLDNEDRKTYYYLKRAKFNELKMRDDTEICLESAALFIFLNKTCFNGLYRVNRKGLFNVPIGSYKKPMICDCESLESISSALKNVAIICGDYHQSAGFIDKHTLVYIDPPYRPLTDTANFTAYTENNFDDDAQRKLAQFVDLMNEREAKIIVSNSDPKNANSKDSFFDLLYAGYRIERIEATRMINCNSEARGKINELLIYNY